MTVKRALIVGSGIGGMALSVLLANDGFKTTVYEKNHLLGGRCTSYEKLFDGEKYIVDMWTHTFPTAERAFNKIFKKINSDYRIKFYHFSEDNPPEIWGNKGRKTTIPTSLEGFNKQLEEMRIKRSQKKKKSKKPRDPNRPKPKITKLFSDIFSLPKKKMMELNEITFEDFLKRYNLTDLMINQLGIVCAFMFVNMAYDSSVKRGSAAGETIQAMRSWFGKITSGYPLGGSVGIVNGYKKVLEDFYGNVEINKEIKKIIVEDEKVTGIEIDGEFIESNLIISNAGIKETVLKLVGEKHFPKNYVKRIKELEVSEGSDTWGFYSIKFGIDEKLIKPPIIFPMIRTDNDKKISSIRELIEDYMMNDALPPSGGMYMTVPSNMDPTLAPHNRQIVNMGCIGPVKSKNYQKWIDFYTDILESLVPGFRKHVLFMDVHRTGEPLQAWTGRFQGDAVGISQSVGQVGALRPKSNTPIKGLFLVGADVGMTGIGTELSALSALTTYKAINSNK
ncbi:MAG: phytoene desaturase family protein [Candidatus Helarchaeota archaeon]